MTGSTQTKTRQRGKNKTSHGPDHVGIGRTHRAAKNFFFSNPLNKLETPPTSDARMARISRRPDEFWRKVRSIPFVADWKVLNDSLFLIFTFIIGLVSVVSLSILLFLGFALSLLWIGIPILAATFAIIIWAAHMERARLRVFLNLEIANPYRYLPANGRIWSRAWGLVKNPQLWRDLVYLFLCLPIGFLGILIISVPLQFFLSLPVTFFGSNSFVYGWEVNNILEGALAFIVGLIVLVPASIGINLVANLNAEAGRRFLAPRVEDVLTERVEELTESRSAVMRAMHLERRRIERDLHDGAQQRLVSLAMELGLAREKMGTDMEAARKLLEDSHEDAKLVLSELRDLVRGIHPAVLTDRGLDAAISAIAGRSPIPVGVDIDLKDRQPEEVEGTAYFVVVEALTNVAKHAGATAANVSIKRESGWLQIVVSDNGKGGASLADGSGLRGLADRISALDGTFQMSSPVGQGTTITVEIPCA